MRIASATHAHTQTRHIKLNISVAHDISSLRECVCSIRGFYACHATRALDATKPPLTSSGDASYVSHHIHHSNVPLIGTLYLTLL